MCDGNSYISFAKKIGVNVDTLYQWEKQFPEFSDAKKEAFESCQVWWEDLGKKLAQTNPSIWIFNMKARFGWRDREFVREGVKIVDERTFSQEELKKMSTEELKKS